MKRTGALFGVWLYCSLFATTYCKVLVADGPTLPNSEPSRAPVDVSTHPNLGLINQSCGKSDSFGVTSGNTVGLLEMPWMVRLMYQNDGTLDTDRILCVGTLINERYVLTAASCTRSTLPSLVSGRLGDHNTSTDLDCAMEGDMGMCTAPPQIIQIKSIIRHPGYDRRSKNNDIALIRLAKPADLSQTNVNTICLPVGLAEQTKNMDGRTMVVAGLGGSEIGDDQPPNVLTKANVTVVANQECQRLYENIRKVVINVTDICAREDVVGDEGKSCTTTGAAPMMSTVTVNGKSRVVQYGISVFGSRICTAGGVPDIYMRVGHYMDWILDNLSS